MIRTYVSSRKVKEVPFVYKVKTSRNWEIAAANIMYSFKACAPVRYIASVVSDSL